MGLPEFWFHCSLAISVWSTCLETIWKKSEKRQQTDQSLIQPLSITKIFFFFWFNGIVKEQDYSIKRKLFSENGNWQYTHWRLEQTQMSTFPVGMKSDSQGVQRADSTKITTCCWIAEVTRWDTYSTKEIWAGSWLPMGWKGVGKLAAGRLRRGNLSRFPSCLPCGEGRIELERL